jgi:hypothetical protein
LRKRLFSLSSFGGEGRKRFPETSFTLALLNEKTFRIFSLSSYGGEGWGEEPFFRQRVHGEPPFFLKKHALDHEPRIATETGGHSSSPWGEGG